ncbi:alpha/beta hydrolase [bacterium]|nr:MAG: alpha/beta hydrolase [bacterium]
MKQFAVWFLILVTGFPRFASAEVKHIITSDSVDLCVTVKGKGTPCLYIHGGPGSGSWWMEKFSGQMLERNMQMIYLDQRGVGRSTSPKNRDFSFARMVKDFEEVRDALGIKRWLTMGHSFGGILQMQYTLRHPDVIAGMLMLNCTLDITNGSKGALVKAYEFLNDTSMAPYMNDSLPLAVRVPKIYVALREKRLFWKMAYARQSSEATMDSSFREIPRWNHDYERVAMEIPESFANYKPQTSGMKMPVLFFYGKTDWMVGPNHYEGVNFPAMLLWGSDVGHMPFLENNEDLEKAVAAYIKKYGF